MHASRSKMASFLVNELENIKILDEKINGKKDVDQYLE